jgi:D-alanyl-D-alanine carboxypeptidase/D-alanyl-D-alanine-endopeptidase (penicillin-binding protein 4)
LPGLVDEPDLPLEAAVARALAGTRSCVLAETGGRLLVSLDPSLPLAPASTEKLLVAAAALAVLGPEYRFATTVVAPGPPRSGVVRALYLVGSGDPMLAGPGFAARLEASPRYAGAPVTPLQALASELAAAGVRRVADGVHGDDWRLSRTRLEPSWTPGERAEGDVGALGALVADGGYGPLEPVPLPAADPAASAAADLARLLAARGVAAGAGPDAPAPHRGVVLAAVSSAPLSTIVAFMLRSSDNLAAELLTRAVGLAVDGAGSTRAGTAAVVAVDRRLGIDTTGVRLLDGSGLAPGDRATCAALLDVLLAARVDPVLAAILPGLALSGGPGTLRERFLGALAGRVSAKDGFIRGVGAIAGVVRVGRPIWFAMIANGAFSSYAAAAGYEDAVVSLLASASSVSSRAGPGPSGAGPGSGQPARPKQASCVCAGPQAAGSA